MPELPDLEVFRENLFQKLQKQKLTGINVFSPQKVQALESTLQKELAGRSLREIRRVGKELLFDFGDERVVASHLMLNGEMSLVPQPQVEAVRFKIFAMHFQEQSLVFSDRGFLCTIKYMPAGNTVPDAFDEAFTLAYFLRKAHAKARMNIKAFLIDQSIIKGIGNAYADEILWAARISPHSLTGKVPDEALTVLYRSIDSVLREAIASIKRISPDRISGEERSFLRVHNKNLVKTQTGYPVKVEKVASKITYYTDEQMLYH